MFQGIFYLNLSQIMMLKHNLKKEAELMAFPEGTSVTVLGITGILVFAPYPENFNKVIEAVLEYMGKYDEDFFDDFQEAVENTLDDLIELYRKNEGNLIEENKMRNPAVFRTPTLDEIHLFHRFYNAFEFGIQYEQPEDVNVSPRDISKPFIKKGEIVVCYNYKASDYRIINK